ncbi:hypothetical protein llap_4874 [Limosa lapponica baueri]|uniref:Lysyl oxidase homolog n=1 Tax=Limosa lapponica baueri TaxID=1758121 RepID=A0A2I0UFI7_LIMLA|nr:hypothetical protein llap_4874 [Limosa lapponica baueri]
MQGHPNTAAATSSLEPSSRSHCSWGDQSCQGWGARGCATGSSSAKAGKAKLTRHGAAALPGVGQGAATLTDSAPQVVINPNFEVAESDFTNNAMKCNCKYDGHRIWVHSCHIGDALSEEANKRFEQYPGQLNNQIS